MVEVWPSDIFLNLFFPRACVVCQREGDWWCSACRNGAGMPGVHSLEGIPQGVLFLAQFHDPGIREVIHAVKYGGVHELARDAVGVLWSSTAQERAADLWGTLDHILLLPVPLSRDRYKERGYNQAELFARALAKRTGWRVGSGGLQKREGESLVGKSRQERHERVSQLFSLGSLNPEWKKYSVILVDDVLTTGSTLETCGKLLAEAGVMVAGAIVIAYDALA